MQISRPTRGVIGGSPVLHGGTSIRECANRRSEGCSCWWSTSTVPRPTDNFLPKTPNGSDSASICITESTPISASSSSSRRVRAPILQRHCATSSVRGWLDPASVKTPMRNEIARGASREGCRAKVGDSCLEAEPQPHLILCGRASLFSTTWLRAPQLTGVGCAHRAGAPSSPP